MIYQKKSLYPDGVIAPTALNFDFYNKINLLALSDQNPEPKFVIENLRSVNYKIIKETYKVCSYVRKITIKTIAFNSIDNEIGAYLLKSIIRYLILLKIIPK